MKHPGTGRLPGAVVIAVAVMAAALSFMAVRTEAAQKDTARQTAAQTEAAPAAQKKEKPASAAQKAASPEELSFEVKFLLDPDKVLDPDHRLKKEYADLLGIREDWKTIEVMFLDTPEKSFSGEGWSNRLRRKTEKKKYERNYKKRYPVGDLDLRAACEAAAKDGFSLSGNEFEVQADWGYSSMVLSFSLENSSASKGRDSLASFSEAEARAFMKEAMPAREADWKKPGWGLSQMDRAKAAGPVEYIRAKGSLEGRQVTVEIWPVSSASKGRDRRLVELSFKTKGFRDAADGRARLTALLDQEGILLHEDSLKTESILDAWL